MLAIDHLQIWVLMQAQMLKEMLLKKNLDTVVRAYEMASEWAEKNNVELAVAAA